jgi:CRP-like cAMP-binding protein
MLLHTLENILEKASLSHEAVEHLNKHVVFMNAVKGSFLIKEGQHCNHIYIIEKGFARIFSVINGKEVTTLFARENDIITSTHALFTQTGSNENVEVLEDSYILKIDYGEFINLCREQPALFNLFRFIMEKYYLALEERTLSLQFDTALERYRKLLLREPFILQRASLSSIASFLGMSPVTLSRMRAQI